MVSRATSHGRDQTTLLDLALDVDARRGRQAGLEAALRSAIRAGRLVAGARLPSSRSLAAELGWARATVVGAYEQLTVEGYLHAVRGSGTTVAEIPSGDEVPEPSTTARRVLADFRPGEPDRSSFPRADWLRSLRHVLGTAPDDLFGYDDRGGVPALRRELASYLGRSRAVVAHPDRVVVFGGFTTALSVLCTTLERLGRRSLAIEDPSLPFHPAIARSAGLMVRPVPVDDDGLCVDALAAADVDAVLTTPAHQYPLGVTLRASRRAELLAWARERDAWIIEDDYDGELRYDRQSVGALQGLDPERVVYAGTASKMLAPGVALSWLVVPTELLGPIRETRRWRLAVSTIEQAALADFIASGRLDRHVRRVRSSYRRRRDALVEVLPSQCTVQGISAGLHVTMLLPAGAPSEDELLASAAAASIAMHPLAVHRITPGAPGVVIGYGRPPAHAFAAALDRLASFLGETLPDR
jgi:GntR family transcriptional regulator/MocR family aminotransferase